MTFVARADHRPFTPPLEDSIGDRSSEKRFIERGPLRAPATDRTADSAQAEAQRNAERRALTAYQQQAQWATANSAGLGESAEEITFGTSEREEIEAHDDARDAQSSKVERALAMMRVDAIKTMLRQLAGDHQFASIRQRAERFASLWAQGKDVEAAESLDVDTFSGSERQALMTLALKNLAPGSRAEVRDATASDSPLFMLLQSPPTPRQVLDAKASIGEQGLDRLAAMAVPRGRVDPRLSRGAEVFLSLSLLRAIQQVRAVEVQAQRLLKAGNCPGAGKPEETHKCAEWLIATAFSPAPQSSVRRMDSVLRVNGDALASVRRQLQRALPDLPAGIWLNGETKQLVRQELSEASTRDLEHRGLLNRYGLVQRAT